jgi:hypothetical protein
LGLRGGRIADDLDPVSELHTLDQFWQLVVAVDPVAVCFRRVSPVAVRPGEGLLNEPTPAVRPWSRERVFMRADRLRPFRSGK